MFKYQSHKNVKSIFLLFNNTQFGYHETAINSHRYIFVFLALVMLNITHRLLCRGGCLFSLEWSRLLKEEFTIFSKDSVKNALCVEGKVFLSITLRFSSSNLLSSFKIFLKCT